MTAVVIYARTDPGTPVPPDDQVLQCREHAARQGWIVAEAHADMWVAGTDRERAGLTAALADLGPAAPVLLVQGISRLTRSRAHLAEIERAVHAAGARIAVVEGQS